MEGFITLFFGVLLSIVVPVARLSKGNGLSLYAHEPQILKSVLKSVEETRLRSIVPKNLTD